MEALTAYFGEVYDDPGRARAAAVRFATHFAGCRLEMPTRDDLNALIRIDALMRDPSSSMVARLADVHGMDCRAVSREFCAAMGYGVERWRTQPHDPLPPLAWPQIPKLRRPLSPARARLSDEQLHAYADAARKQLAANPLITRIALADKLGITRKHVARLLALLGIAKVRTTRPDLQAKVANALRKPELATLSDYRLGKRLGVPPDTVARVRRVLAKARTA